jgi:hypothetical protein
LRKVRDHFDWEEKIDVIINVYREVAGKGVVKGSSATNASAPKPGPRSDRKPYGRPDDTDLL